MNPYVAGGVTFSRRGGDLWLIREAGSSSPHTPRAQDLRRCADEKPGDLGRERAPQTLRGNIDCIHHEDRHSHNDERDTGGRESRQAQGTRERMSAGSRGEVQVAQKDGDRRSKEADRRHREQDPA